MAGEIKLVVPNITDFNVRHEHSCFNPITERRFETIGRAFADQSVFWTGSRRVVVLYPGFDPLWLTDVHTALQAEEPPIVTPTPSTGRLVSDLLLDGRAMADLRGHLGRPRVVRLVCWGATPELYRLAAQVHSWGHQIALDIPDEEDYWVSTYLDSKTSCVGLATSMTELRVPRSVTAGTWDELRGSVGTLLAHTGAAVVKAAHGAGGAGTAVVGAGPAGVEEFWRSIENDPFFSSFPMIVQEYVDGVPELGCLSVDFFSGDAGLGKPVLSMTDADEHQFVSVRRRTGILPAQLEDVVIGQGAQLGSLAGDLGFRGWLGADFLPARDGRLYFLELNARRTGGLHSIGLLRQSQDSTPVMCSLDTFTVSAVGPLAYSDVRPAFQQMWQEGRPVYPTTVRGLGRARPLLGVTGYGRNPAEACALVDDVCRAIDAATALVDRRR